MTAVTMTDTKAIDISTNVPSLILDALDLSLSGSLEILLPQILNVYGTIETKDICNIACFSNNDNFVDIEIPFYEIYHNSHSNSMSVVNCELMNSVIGTVISSTSNSCIIRLTQEDQQSGDITLRIPDYDVTYDLRVTILCR